MAKVSPAATPGTCATVPATKPSTGVPGSDVDELGGAVGELGSAVEDGVVDELGGTADGSSVVGSLGLPHAQATASNAAIATRPLARPTMAIRPVLHPGSRHARGRSPVRSSLGRSRGPAALLAAGRFGHRDAMSPRLDWSGTAVLVVIVVAAVASTAWQAQVDRSGLIEAVLQAVYATSIGTAAFSAVHLTILGLVQLWVFWRFGFAWMLGFRLAYYALWHVVWGAARLEVLF
jgi:hypothetical protein